MSDDFEDLLKRWLRDRSRTDPSTLQALAGNVAALPPRRRNRPSRLLPLAASIVVLLGAIAFLAPRLGNVGGEADPTVTPSADASQGSALPGGPEAFAGDPRLDRCAGSPDDMEFVFEMSHARDYQLYLPAMLLSPELDVDAPALVVVYRGRNPMPYTGPSGVGTRPPLGPTERDLCIVVGEAPQAEVGYYDAVDITGLTIDVRPDTETPSSLPTPRPAWLGGATAALACDGRHAEFKPDWTRGELYTTGRGTPELAIAELAHRANSYGVPFPNAGWEDIGRVESTRAFGYFSRGTYRAVVILAVDDADQLARWWVDDVAVCQAAELGPDAETGVRTERWTDAAGSPVDAAVVETPDCYFGTKLQVDGRLFVWMPGEDAGLSYGTGLLEAPIGVIEAVPDDALDSGYRSTGRTLLLAADGTAAFVILPDGVQRWAHVTGDDFQRTDCN